MTVAFIGIDLAKNVFQLHGANADGQAVLKRRIRREGLLAEIAELEPCVIGVEACNGAFYWQRQFEALGHTVKVIAPQYVKPFVKHQKNQNDAEAICTALMLPNMKFVPTKSEEQQDIQALHRARRRLVNHRTALVSQMRGLLLDRGIPIALSIGRAWRAIPGILAVGVIRPNAMFSGGILCSAMVKTIQEITQNINVYRSLCSSMLRIIGAQERTRTSTALRPLAPEASASTIPPPGQVLWSRRLDVPKDAVNGDFVPCW